VRIYRCYLSGPITGLNLEEAQGWRKRVTDELVEMGCEVYDPLRGEAALSNQEVIQSDLETMGKANDPLITDAAIVSGDFHDVRNCDIVLANFLGAQRVSTGSVCEITMAYEHDKVIILVMEKDGTNLHDNPFIRQMQSVWVETLEEAVEVIHRYSRVPAGR
jgi:nucleoside 2-deoxyribosyltransferase